MFYYKITCSNDFGIMTYYMAATDKITKKYRPVELQKVLAAGGFDIDSIERISKDEYVEKLSKEGLPED